MGKLVGKSGLRTLMKEVPTRFLHIAEKAARQAKCLSCKETRIIHKLDIVTPVEIVGTDEALRLFDRFYGELMRRINDPNFDPTRPAEPGTGV